MTSDEAMQEAWEENRMWLGQDDALFKSGWYAALEWAKSGQGPVAYMNFNNITKETTYTKAPVTFDRAEVYTNTPLFRYPAPAQPETQIIAWVRVHPDGALTEEILFNSRIDEVRKKSGAWLPLVFNQAQPAAEPCEPSANAKRTLDNPPERIYLQVGDVESEYPGEISWRDVSWCDEQIDRSDLVYVRSDLAQPAVVQQLVEALEDVLPYVATQSIGCHGYKCRESWCWSCNGDDEAEEAANRGAAAHHKARAALAVYKEQTK